MTAPYFVSYPRRIRAIGEFTAYEIQTVREELRDGPGGTFHTVTTLEEAQCEADNLGPVIYGVYGRNPNGTVEHLFDRKTKEAAEETLTKMGVLI